MKNNSQERWAQWSSWIAYRRRDMSVSLSCHLQYGNESHQTYSTLQRYSICSMKKVTFDLICGASKVLRRSTQTSFRNEMTDFWLCFVLLQLLLELFLEQNWHQRDTCEYSQHSHGAYGEGIRWASHGIQRLAGLDGKEWWWRNTWFWFQNENNDKYCRKCTHKYDEFQ